MTIRVGINGFGRIGRSVFRILADRPGIEVVAINDLTTNRHLAYLLRYDTVMGVFEGDVRTDADSLTVGGRRIAMTSEKDPSRIPWRDHGADVVVESTGKILTREALSKHLAAGARRVVLTVPAKDEIDAMSSAIQRGTPSASICLSAYSGGMCTYDTGRPIAFEIASAISSNVSASGPVRS